MIRYRIQVKTNGRTFWMTKEPGKITVVKPAAAVWKNRQKAENVLKSLKKKLQAAATIVECDDDGGTVVREKEQNKLEEAENEELTEAPGRKDEPKEREPTLGELLVAGPNTRTPAMVNLIEAAYVMQHLDEMQKNAEKRLKEAEMALIDLAHLIEFHEKEFTIIQTLEIISEYARQRKIRRDAKDELAIIEALKTPDGDALQVIKNFRTRTYTVRAHDGFYEKMTEELKGQESNPLHLLRATGR